MILIVGLGNPGEKHQNTRHNLGVMVVEAVARKLLPVEETKWKLNKKFDSELIVHNQQFVLAKPQTFMNASGLAVAKIASFYKIKPEDIWVIHDEIDLSLGRIRAVKKRGSAGHRGVESIIKELGTNQFVRFRLGVGYPGPDSSEKEVEGYVLSPFVGREKNEARKMIKKAVRAIKLALRKGLEKWRDF